MWLARVLGSTVSTIKHSAYAGRRIMVVQPLDLALADGGPTSLAVDAVGSGPGEVVVVCDEGYSTCQVLGFDALQPLRSIIVAIVEHVELEDGRTLYASHR